MAGRWMIVGAFLLLISWGAQAAEPDMLSQTAQALQVRQGEDYRQHVTKSEQLSLAFAALTGEAINPLFGVTARSVYVWWRTPAQQRPNLSWYYQPRIWAPLLTLLLAMAFKGTVLEAAPMLKKPLDAAGDLVSKGGAIAGLPLVLAMFAESFAVPVEHALTAVVDGIFPTAYAAEGAAEAGNGIMTVVGWFVSCTLGLAVYVIVWLAFNTIEVLILICPFPAVDAALKSFRLGMMGILAGVRELSPTAGAILSVLLILLCALIAGWSLRLSVFGWIFSTDMLFFRSRRLRQTFERVLVFSSGGLKGQVPVRTLGWLARTPAGELCFSYRPWLVLPRRELPIDTSVEELAVGQGVINPYVVQPTGETAFSVLFRLPPRYQGHEMEAGRTLGIESLRDTSILRGLRAFWRMLIGDSSVNLQPVSPH